MVISVKATYKEIERAVVEHALKLRDSQPGEFIEFLTALGVDKYIALELLI